MTSVPSVSGPPTPSAPIPLYVDVDGTLIRTDLLIEGILQLLKCRFATLLLMPLWLLKGKAELKRQVADRIVIDPALLPYDEELVSYLRAESNRKRPIFLASASDERMVTSIGSHLGFVTDVLGTRDGRNLKGKSKAQAIAGHAGSHAFAYAGNARADLDVWRVAEEAIVVNATPHTERSARAVSRVVRVFPKPRAGLSTFVRLIRIHQWLKNLLVFVPLLVSNRFTDPIAVQAAVAAFLAFSLCASGTYVFNDLLDLPSDRRHPSKKSRPVAAGLVEPAAAIWVSTILVAAGLAVAALACRGALPSLTLYLLLTLAYSLHLKTLVIVDALVLASLYALRVFAGASAVNVVPSAWLLGFSIFIFLSLALVKRCSELQRMATLNRPSTPGRDYRVSDLPLLQTVGVASGQVSVLIIALYIDSSIAAAQYKTPQILWFTCPLLLYWISRMWLKTARGEMHDDPIVYSARDRASWMVFAAIAAVWVAARMSIS
jgi:4-hydroxybenzoate polyprenyltransferase